MVAVCTFTASDTATKEAMSEAFHAAHIKRVLTSLGGTTVSVWAEDEEAARKLVQKLAEEQGLPIHPVPIVAPSDSGKKSKPRRRSGR